MVWSRLGGAVTSRLACLGCAGQLPHVGVVWVGRLEFTQFAFEACRHQLPRLALVLLVHYHTWCGLSWAVPSPVALVALAMLVFYHALLWFEIGRRALGALDTQPNVALRVACLHSTRV